MKTTLNLAMLGAALASSLPALAQEPVRIGFITTLSTPAGYLGEDARDAFRLAMDQEGGKLGGVPVELVVEDDGLQPAKGKQIIDRMSLDGISLYTGVMFSNVLAAVVNGATQGDRFYISTNAAPSNLAGAQCKPNYFAASYQNDVPHEMAGVAANDLGYTKMVILAPNYQAGRDALAGFKRTFKGEVTEIYTKLNQLDFSVELARIRSLNPDAVFQFHPGGAGINFAKQYGSSGLSKSIPMVVPVFSMDERMLAATGNVAEGVNVVSGWNPQSDNPANQAFIRAFTEKYNRAPTMYAAQGYDTARLIGSALKATNGDLKDADAFRAALRDARFDSVRGDFRFGSNQHAVIDWHLLKVQAGADGKLAEVPVKTIAKAQVDSYATQCAL
ncbi:ABC transporter substrate-binding protein [Pseudomonas sp. JS3066]|jgi:branched-chain amino acid transport system substrate-binding protein|uniref:ABC transporter substrate-binding protein n=1 Tax=unclassified Pseudomonas TaxID=196821 RepID=UPI000EAABA63|nr:MULTISPECIES: ABC transporter substrate-binding protein [unclassified Pseudomonas]AYF90691.1 ABC transporter substrate-binding protein [Pseudomonas sp. DY-1]MDH4652693.1 ABC transporter substrate-binding protein [Pseudomonas sp. BN606]MRK20470.1 ABC transporter substrate-binding protein [Pseudomonas sp. JG-B]WVK91739.1 ABC transporter substrate-binding protein [Pseudomonas sp. JS3066]